MWKMKEWRKNIKTLKSIMIMMFGNRKWKLKAHREWKKSRYIYWKQMKLFDTSVINVNETFGMCLNSWPLTILIRQINKNKNICLRISHWLDELSKTLIEAMDSHLIKFHELNFKIHMTEIKIQHFVCLVYYNNIVKK